MPGGVGVTQAWPGREERTRPGRKRPHHSVCKQARRPVVYHFRPHPGFSPGQEPPQPGPSGAWGPPRARREWGAHRCPAPEPRAGADTLTCATRSPRQRCGCRFRQRHGDRHVGGPHAAAGHGAGVGVGPVESAAASCGRGPATGTADDLSQVPRGARGSQPLRGGTLHGVSMGTALSARC